MALVVLLRKPPEHGRVVHICFRAAVPVEEKEIAVTVNRDRLRSFAVLQHAPQRFMLYVWLNLFSAGDSSARILSMSFCVGQIKKYLVSEDKILLFCIANSDNSFFTRYFKLSNAYKEDIDEIKGVLAEIWRLQRLSLLKAL